MVDTHCKIDERCVERRCVPVGAVIDAGADAATDAGGDAARDSSTVDSGTRDSGTPDTGPALVGRVMALSDSLNMGAGPAPRGLATASFGPEVEDGCMHRTAGGCALIDCPDTTPPTMDGGVDSGVLDSGVLDSSVVDSGIVDSGSLDAGVDAGPPPAPNAGIIIVNGGLALATLAPNADGTYPVAASPMLLWPDGSATVRFNALGRVPGVAAFEQSVPAPSTVILTTPDSTVAPITFNLLSGIDVAWTGSTNGVVLVSLTQSAAAPSTAHVSLSCEFDGATTRANIPAIALRSFAAGSAQLSLLSTSAAMVSGADPWNIEVTAVASGALVDGTAAVLSVTLE